MSQLYSEVSKHIRTLTTVLERLKARCGPDITYHHRETPRILNSFITLLTCGDEDTATAAKVVAAMGRFERDGTARVLIAINSKSTVSTLSVKKISKAAKSFKEVVNG